jgi:hypothetical protein
MVMLLLPKPLLVCLLCWHVAAVCRLLVCLTAALLLVSGLLVSSLPVLLLAFLDELNKGEPVSPVNDQWDYHCRST